MKNNSLIGWLEKTVSIIRKSIKVKEAQHFGQGPTEEEANGAVASGPPRNKNTINIFC
jgi:hypothetical protein